MSKFNEEIRYILVLLKKWENATQSVKINGGVYGPNTKLVKRFQSRIFDVKDASRSSSPVIYR